MNGFQIHLGPLTGLDLEFNRIVGDINTATTPKALQEARIAQAMADDVTTSFLRSSSFYDPERYIEMMSVVTDNLTNTFEPSVDAQYGLDNLIIPRGITDSLQYLTIPIDAFNRVMNDPNFGQDFVAPVRLQKDPTGALAYPVLPETGLTDLGIAALSRLGLVYTSGGPDVYGQTLAAQGFGALPLSAYPINALPPNAVGAGSSFAAIQQAQLQNAAFSGVPPLAFAQPIGLHPQDYLTLQAFYLALLSASFPGGFAAFQTHPPQQVYPHPQVQQQNYFDLQHAPLQPLNRFGDTLPNSYIGVNSLGGYPPFFPGMLTVQPYNVKAVGGFNLLGQPVESVVNPIIGARFVAPEQAPPRV